MGTEQSWLADKADNNVSWLTRHAGLQGKWANKEVVPEEWMYLPLLPTFL
jgi:hypothetical protein